MVSRVSMENLKPRINLESIEQSLREVQNDFPTLNNRLGFSRERMGDEVVENLLSGYAFISQLLESKVELFAIGNSSFLLELNTRVLCGTDERNRREYKKHIAATTQYFYERTDAGIQDLSDWYELHRNGSVWHRAAGTFIRILSEPQLFIEGNDRTGALVVSYILVKEGQPPFVLSIDNAHAYFNYSSQVKSIPRNGLSRLIRIPLLQAGIASFLKDQASTAHLH